VKKKLFLFLIFNLKSNFGDIFKKISLNSSNFFKLNFNNILNITKKPKDGALSLFLLLIPYSILAILGEASWYNQRYNYSGLYTIVKIKDKLIFPEISLNFKENIIVEEIINDDLKIGDTFLTKKSEFITKLESLILNAKNQKINNASLFKIIRREIINAKLENYNNNFIVIDVMIERMSQKPHFILEAKEN